MVVLDHVQNLHIHAEKTHKDFGAHCMKYVNFVHDPEKQYRSTVPAVRPLSIGLQVTEYMYVLYDADEMGGFGRTVLY